MQSHSILKELHKPIVLVGLMGAGKTTVGRRLAKVIGYQFVDSDVEIEEAAGCSITDIFAVYGEPIFRDLELRVISRLLENKHTVIATGGGAWIQEPIRQQIKERGISIWLRAELSVLLERVERRNHRPLLQNGDKKATMEKLMRERYPVYELADLILDSGDGPHEDVVDKAVETILDFVGKTCDAE